MLTSSQLVAISGQLIAVIVGYLPAAHSTDWNATELRFLAEGGLPCFRCTEVVTPEECETTTVCSPSEECVTREVVLEEFVAYKLGCKNKQICKVMRELNTSKQHGECEQCCTRAYCNSHLCKKFDLTQTQCHEGSALLSPHQSAQVLSCPPGEVCYSAQVETDEGFNRYYMGCAAPQACNNETGGIELLYYMSLLASNVQKIRCAKCCKDSFCNQDIC